MNEKITVETRINAPLNKVWDYYTRPEHITQWNNASDDWTTTRAVNDLRVGGRFLSRMEAKDGSEGFDFTGVYEDVIYQKFIAYTMDDGRQVSVAMNEDKDSTKVTVVFDPEKENTAELQRSGWQSILDNFKKYTESN